MASCLSCESDGESEAGIGIVVPEYAEILVIRHGETAWNADGRIQGHMDVELNDNGRLQAVAVADRLAKEREISAVYSSDLKRALDTARLIATRCNVTVVNEDPDLRERHLGDLQGLVLAEAAELKPEAYNASLSLRTDQEIPGGGESLDQLYHRCTTSLEKIARKHTGERVVVVTHSGVLRAFHKRAAAPSSDSPGKIKNASISTFNLDGEGGWTINTWGDITHLSKTVVFLTSGDGADDHTCCY